MGSNTGPNVSSVAKFSAYKGSALHLFRGGTVVLVALALTALTAAPTPAEEVQPQLSKASSTPPTAPELTIDGFLDRLMMAESGGNDAARNQRSTALGPFQFIKSTFVEVARRHFAEETATLSPSAIGALRTNRSFARRAAEAYTKDNAAHLASEGLTASFPNLRLAFLVGPTGAARLLHAKHDTKVASILSSYAIRANPFMARMTVADLVAKCARDLSVSPETTDGITPQKGVPRAKPRPRIAVKCSLRRPSCRRWLALAERRLKRKEARAAKKRNANLR
jgi:hypothetical protein